LTGLRPISIILPMPTAGDRPSPPPRAGNRAELGIWIEDALNLAAVAALVVCAFRVPLGLEGWPTKVILGAALAVAAAVAVRRIRRLIRARRARAEGSRKDTTHAD
jgi:hypothetical protein